MNRTPFSPLLVLWIIVGTLPLVAQTQLSNPPDWYCDRRFTEGRAIIVGSVVKIDPAENLSRNKRTKFKELSGYTIKNVLTIRIDKSYRNDFHRYAYKPAKISVPNLQARNIQAKPFKVGEKFLFYLSALTILKDGLVSFYIDPHSQTKPVSQTADSIAFLERVYKLDLMSEVLGYDGNDAVMGGIISGKAVALPKPAYPKDAKKDKASEAIRVYVLVDETGQVIKAKALCARHAALGNAAERAALNAKFNPILVSGKPIKVQGTITYNFVP